MIYANDSPLKFPEFLDQHNCLWTVWGLFEDLGRFGEGFWGISSKTDLTRLSAAFTRGVDDLTWCQNPCVYKAKTPTWRQWETVICFGDFGRIWGTYFQRKLTVSLMPNTTWGCLLIFQYGFGMCWATTGGCSETCQTRFTAKLHQETES